MCTIRRHLPVVVDLVGVVGVVVAGHVAAEVKKSNIVSQILHNTENTKHCTT